MSKVLQRFEDTKKVLDKTSCSLCLAKWSQVTLHLQLGHNHSCHHPAMHKIPLEEIAEDPSALHNTKYKKQLRKQMLEGERPSECDYCWRVEDSAKDNKTFSDRITKSSEDWSMPLHDKIVNSPYDANINPSYLEVSFSNVCNFKCSYCSPEISSKWMEEVKQFGGYPTHKVYNNPEWLEAEGRMPIPHNQENPYVNAFWDWWPDLYPELKVFRITGGEPLLSKDTFKVLDYIIENPNPNLELNINSNLNIPDGLFNKFIEKMKRIQGEGLVKEFKIYTSCEAKGEKTEYIRFGMDYNKWKDNLCRVLSEIPRSKVANMATYNLLSVSSYKDFLTDMIDIRNGFVTKDRITPLSLDTSYLRWPWHQTIFLLDQPFLKQVEDTVTYMYKNPEVSVWFPLTGKGFYDFEIHRMRRIYSVMQDKLNDQSEEKIRKININKRDFAIFVDEHDRRRGTDFLKTFPEYEDFYNSCKALI